MLEASWIGIAGTSPAMTVVGRPGARRLLMLMRLR
jgi:hypothetical protein